MFFEVCSSFCGIFLLIRIRYLLVLLDILSGGGLHAILFLEFLFVTMVHILRFREVTFEVEVLLGVYGFVVNVVDNLAIFIFNEDV